MYKLFMTCAGGLEEVCQNELIHLGIKKSIIDQGGVRFEGTLDDIYRINLWSRTGIRLLVRVSHYRATTTDELYNNSRAIPWSKFLDHEKTFAIDAVVSRAKINNNKFAALRLKDAIADYFMEKRGERPSVNRENPDVRFNLFIKHDYATVYLDSSGIPLSRRGYRTVLHKASLNESLAAGILYLSEWDAKSPLFDPLCGSGTFLIEAAMMAAGQAPGLLRKKFGFMSWKDFDRKLWNSIKTEAQIEIDHNQIPPLYGSDISKESINLAEQNVAAAGLSEKIEFNIENIKDFAPVHKSGTIICNPPYGERMGRDDFLPDLYSHIGDVLKQNCSGYNAFIFTGNPELGKKVGLRTSRKIPLRNGNIECRLLKYELYSGTKKVKK